MGGLDESAPYFADYFVIVRQGRLGNLLEASGSKTLASKRRDSAAELARPLGDQLGIGVPVLVVP